MTTPLWKYDHVSAYLRFIRSARKAFAEGYRSVQVSWCTDWTEREFKEQFILALHCRINLKAGINPQGRNYDDIQQTEMMRDAQKIKDLYQRKISIHQFNSIVFRKRLSHLVNGYYGF